MYALRFAIRHLRRNAGHVAFHLFGLTIGILAFVFIALFVMHEWSYDRHNTHFENIYRVESSLTISNDHLDYAIAPPAVGESITAQVPGILTACRFFPQTGYRFFLNNETIRENRVTYADQSLFSVFTFDFIDGNLTNALKEPNSIVLTKNAALKYFRRVDVNGESISILRDDSVYTLKVTGVVGNLPSTSHFQFDFFISMSSFPLHTSNNFLSFYPFATYVVAARNVDVSTIQRKMNRWIHSSIPDYAEIAKGGNKIDFILTPLVDIHLTSHKKYELGTNSDRRYVYIFSTAAIFILLMAGINFMNLSLARFARRSKEAGIKKILGSSARALSLQFVLESILLCLASAALSIIGVWLLLPAFAEFTNKSFPFVDVFEPIKLSALFIVTSLFGVITGIYPSITYSSIAERKVIGNSYLKLAVGYSVPISRLLLVVQFCVSTFLITATVIIYHQLQFIQEKDAGYARNGILVVQNASVLRQPSIFKEKVLQLTGVMTASFSNYLPTNESRWSNFGGLASSDSPVETQFWPVDANYISTLGMRMVAGRNFSSTYGTDSSAIILNETAYRQFGGGKNILSQHITYSYHQEPTKFTVIGVVEDFHFSSLHEKIGPLAFVLSDNMHANLIVRYRADAGGSVRSAVEGIWQTLQTREKIDVRYLDEDFSLTYRDDALTGRVFIIFAVVSILLASLGLYGLTKYSIENRKKELAIRSVLGASAASLTLLLSQFYTRLIFLSVLITMPVSVFYMTRWLQDFAYRYNVQWFDYAIGAGVSVMIPVIVLLAKVLSVKSERLIDHIKV